MNAIHLKSHCDGLRIIEESNGAREVDVFIRFLTLFAKFVLEHGWFLTKIHVTKLKSVAALLPNMST